MLHRVTKERRSVTTAVGLTLSGHLYKRHFARAMTSRDVIGCWQQLLHYRTDGFILICDHAHIHTSAETLRFLFEHPEIIVEPLPKYAPELNPEEYCHGDVKAHLANATPHSVEQIRQWLDQGFSRLRRRPDLLVSFIHAAGLPVKQLWLL